MDSKKISIREDVYRKLKAARGPDETFSDVIERLLSERNDDHPLYDLEGILDEEEAAELRDRVEAFRESLDEEMDRYR